MLGLNVWPGLIHPDKPLAPVRGAAFSFWAALSTLSALGVRYPLKMSPLLILQLFYKSVWLLAVALPLWSAGQFDSAATAMTRIFVIGVVADLLAIPWPYVLANYVRTPGDRWKFARQHSAPIDTAGTGDGRVIAG